MICAYRLCTGGTGVSGMQMLNVTHIRCLVFLGVAPLPRSCAGGESALTLLVPRSPLPCACREHDRLCGPVGVSGEAVSPLVLRHQPHMGLHLYNNTAMTDSSVRPNGAGKMPRIWQIPNPDLWTDL